MLDIENDVYDVDDAVVLTSFGDAVDLLDVTVAAVAVFVVALLFGEQYRCIDANGGGEFDSRSGLLTTSMLGDELIVYISPLKPG